MFEQICTLTRKMRELKLGENGPVTVEALIAAAIAGCDVPASTTDRTPVKIFLADLAAAVLAGKTYSAQHPAKAAVMVPEIVAKFDAAATYTPPAP